MRREPPVFLASPSTELLAEPAAGSAVFLAAAALMMTASQAPYVQDPDARQRPRVWQPALGSWDFAFASG